MNFHNEVDNTTKRSIMQLGYFIEKGVDRVLPLTYNSRGGTGLLGVGWGISGLSAITRCAKTYAQDDEKVGVKLDATDRYCLNGQRLVPADGDYTNYGADQKEYRTEIDSYSKIVSHGSQLSGPHHFTVQTKAGRIMEYGNGDTDP